MADKEKKRKGFAKEKSSTVNLNELPQSILRIDTKRVMTPINDQTVESPIKLKKEPPTVHVDDTSATGKQV